MTFVGQRYFRRRPIGPLLRALKRMGLELEYEGQSLPVKVHPGLPRGGRIRIDGMLSQWVSGLLMLAPFAQEPTTVEVLGELNERGFLVLTVEMMREFGLEIEVREDWREFHIPPCQQAVATDVVLPPDIGSAMFGLAACALHPSNVTFRSPVPIHGHPEASVLTELQSVGVPMRFRDDGLSISIEHDGVPPVAGRLDCRDIPDMVPILSTLASRARGRTVLSHVAHAQLKESDRVGSMLQLRKMGARIEFDGNDMEFDGVDQLHGGFAVLVQRPPGADGARRRGLDRDRRHRDLLPVRVSNLLPGVRRTHEHDRDPDRRHPAAAELAGGFEIAGLGGWGRVPAGELILDHVERHARLRPAATAVYEFAAAASNAGS